MRLHGHAKAHTTTRCVTLALYIFCGLFPLGSCGDGAGVDSGCARDKDELFHVHSKDLLTRSFLWIGVCVLVLLSGLFAGLSLGFMGLDKIGLEIVESAGDPESARCAKIIAPVRQDGNLLLVSLLTGNVAVNVLISILMSDLTSGLLGFILSTLLIVVFGDIVPQAVCSRHALQIGAKAVPVVRLIEALLYPLAKPMALVLDKVLGDELGTIHSREELLKLLQIHVKHGSVDAEAGCIVTGALSYSDTKVFEVMTPVAEVFSLPQDGILDYKTISTIFKAGFSRIPIHGADKQDVIGLLYTKDLILVDPGDWNFMAFFGRRPPCVWPDTPLHEVLRLFKTGQGHMALVKDVVDQGHCDPYYTVRGIVTLEDVVQFIIGGGIVEEQDSFTQLPDHVGLDQRHLDSDSCRLRLLDRSVTDECLSAQEVKAVAGYLLSHVPMFKSLSLAIGSSEVFLEKLSEVLSQSRLVTLQAQMGPSNAGNGFRHTEDVIYQKGEISNTCTVILNGKLRVACGADDFLCDAGPWTVLAAESLLVPAGQYAADFTATIPQDEKVRCVQIQSDLFRKYIDPPASALAGTNSANGEQKGPATGWPEDVSLADTRGIDVIDRLDLLEAMNKEEHQKQNVHEAKWIPSEKDT